MKRILFLSLFVQAAFGAQVSVNFLSSSHQLKDGDVLVGAQTADNKPIGCNKENADTTCEDELGNLVPCNCPVGSFCNEGTGSEPNVCSVQAIPQGADSIFDFSAASIVSVPTQVPFLEAFVDVKTDGTLEVGRKDKYGLVRVVVSDIPNAAKYNGCSVELTGDTVDAALDTPDLEGAVVFGATDPNNGGKTLAFCEFRPLNKGYLGNIDARVTFTKERSEAQDEDECLDADEPCEELFEVRLKFVASEDDANWHDWEFANKDGADNFNKLFPSHAPDATTDHFKTKSDNHGDGQGAAGPLEVFRFNTFGDKGFDDSTAYAIRGLLALPIEGIFYDARYKIVHGSGISGLLTKIGDLKIRKEGLDLHDDFKGYYDATKNVFDNNNVDMDPVADYADYAAARVELHADLAEVAQYKLSHTYGMIYGGPDKRQLPHFAPEYLGCQICPGRITVKGFKQPNAYADASRGDVPAEQFQLRYHTSIDSSALPTSTNTFAISDVDIEAASDPLFKPTSIDPNPANQGGRALSEIFEVKRSETMINYSRLDDEFNILGDRLDFDAVELEGVGCEGDAKLYQYAYDPIVYARELFEDTCKIKVLPGAFGDTRDIKYTNHANTEHTSTITVTDNREIALDRDGGTKLTIGTRSVDESAETNGNVVTFIIQKSGVTGAVDFQVLGRNTMIGFDLDGVKCTEIDTATGCHGVISADEEFFSTSADDGVKITHTVRSSPDCLSYFDIQLVDVSHPAFAKYDIRLPCLQSSGSISDSITLKYHFEGQYVLSTDKYTATISYDNDGGKLGILEAGFGKCGKNTDGKDVLIQPAACKNADVAYKTEGEAGYDATPVHFPLYEPGQPATAGWTELSGGVF